MPLLCHLHASVGLGCILYPDNYILNWLTSQSARSGKEITPNKFAIVFNIIPSHAEMLPRVPREGSYIGYCTPIVSLFVLSGIYTITALQNGQNIQCYFLNYLIYFIHIHNNTCQSPVLQHKRNYT